MNKRNLHLLLLLISWTASSGQTQDLLRAPKDTSCSYTTSELRVIASKLISGSECDTLLKVANVTVATQKKAIQSMQLTINQQDSRFIEASLLADKLEAERDIAQEETKIVKRKLLWTKVGWAATGVILTITTVLALIL